METLPATIHTARTTHRCSPCGGLIHPGEKYERWVTFDCGSASTAKAHCYCGHMLGAYLRYDEGFFDYEWREFRDYCESEDAGKRHPWVRGNREWETKP